MFLSYEIKTYYLLLLITGLTPIYTLIVTHRHRGSHGFHSRCCSSG